MLVGLFRRLARWNLRLLGDRKARLGRKGERLAAAHLRRQGLRPLIRNYRCDVGEVDLIFSKGPELVFVEVKSRTNDSDRLESPVMQTQWRRVELAARHFIQRHRFHDRPARFDLVIVDWRGGSKPNLEHVVGAYTTRNR